MNALGSMLQQAENVNPEVGWFALSPLIALVGGALTMMLVGALTPTWPRGLYAFVCSTTAGTAAVLAMFNWDDISDEGPSTLVAGALAFDTFSMFVTITIAVSVVLVAMLTDAEIRGTPNDGPEVYALYLVAAAGGITMASANDLIVLFLGLETLSLALYVLAASNRRSDASAESGLKYFVLGGFASAFLLYGIALVYGATGTTNISEMVQALGLNLDSDNDALALAGIALMMVGLAFKIAAAPFHMWAPDVYQGAPSQVTAFMASVGKTAAFGAMLRVLVVGLPVYRDDWQPIVWVLALLSLVVGAFLAIVQSDVKRMLAYSSISHAGFILVGLEAAAHTAGDPDPGPGMPAMMVYLFAYSIIVIGSFGVVMLVTRDGDTSLHNFSGLARRNPALALGFTVLVLAQAGIPFTTGFIAKFAVIQAAIDVDSYAIAIIAMVTAVVAAFMYLRVMVDVWLHDPADGAPRVSVPVGAGLAIAAAAIFTLGAVPGWLVDAAETVTDYVR